MLRARAAKGIEEEVEQGVRIPVGQGFAGRIAAERRAIMIADVDHADILNPILREKGIRSLLGVPLLVEGRVLGVLHVGCSRRASSPTTTPTCSSSPPTAPRSRSSTRGCTSSAASPRRCSAALLPERLAERPRARGRRAATSRPRASSLGGDWYDVFTLAGGRDRRRDRRRRRPRRRRPRR